MTVENQTLTGMEAPQLRGLVPLSVIIHARSNPGLLTETITACSENAGGCELEFVVLHGQPLSADVDDCKRIVKGMQNISWRSIAIHDEHDPRNPGVQAARYGHVLFLGDGVRPAGEDFFRVHASLHGSCSERDFAVLGAIDNGVSFNLGRFLESGEQLAAANPVASTFLNPCYFSDSNISVKKSLVQDWLTDGFSRDFPGPLGGVELAYRLSKRHSRELKIFYEPTARTACERAPALSEMFQPYVQLGRLLRLFIDRYPEAARSFGLDPYLGASKEPAALQADYFTIIEGLKAWARIVDRRAGVQAESWYSGFAESILEACLFQGFSAKGGQTISAVPGRLISERFMRRLRLTLHDELGINSGPLAWGKT